MYDIKMCQSAPLAQHDNLCAEVDAANAPLSPERLRPEPTDKPGDGTWKVPVGLFHASRYTFRLAPKSSPVVDCQQQETAIYELRLVFDRLPCAQN